MTHRVLRTALITAAAALAALLSTASLAAEKTALVGGRLIDGFGHRPLADSGIPTKFHCQSTWNELAAWVYEMGIDPMDAIQSATYWPAVMMGVSDRTGTVTAGKLADIIAVRGDVLRYINLLQHVELVVKGGTVYKRDGRPVESAL